MGIDIVRGAIKNPEASRELVNTINTIQSDFHGTLFLGYPLAATSESIVTIDALLILKEKGLIAFIFDDGSDYEERQNQLYYQITNTLNSYESLRKKRSLAVSPNIISFFSHKDIPQSSDEYIYANSENLKSEIERIKDFEIEYYEKLIEALQKISTLKPRKKRKNVNKTASKGAVIKKIEQQIANLDQWQKKAAYEIPEGPQRIRGLAGSGKTVVLALKAAYIHAQYPEWNIAVTYYTRSLYQQFRSMIINFYNEYLKEEPDWTKLHILPAWGTYYEDGIYSIVARHGGFTPLTYENAKTKYGSNNAFSGICSEAVGFIGNKELGIYDAVLIDEAQDLPSDFFKMCYRLLKQPKRIVFAYDELQNLSDKSMPTLTEMFGKDKNGNDIVVLENRGESARQDIILPVCYRNTPWALSLAHSLGFGIYNKQVGIFQLFSDKGLWSDIGYYAVSGEVKAGKKVKLKRKEDAAPNYFKELLNSNDAVVVKVCKSKFEQYKWVADEILKNITEDELDPDDVLVIFPQTYYAKTDYADFRKYLNVNGIMSKLIGVETDRDTFKVDGYVSCCHIHRAKGNEAPIVYILNSEYCSNSDELRKVRNILFTAITRSRAWVRICGVGEEMRSLFEEAEECINNDYALEFIVPTDEDLKKINLIHRERTEQEAKNLKKASGMMRDLIGMIQRGEIDVEEIPEFSVFASKLGLNKGDTYIEEDE